MKHRPPSFPDARDGGKPTSRHPSQFVLGGLVVAAGILVPILFHQIGLGPVFLPMFLPIALGAFFLRPTAAAAAGAVTPLLSAFITGMPPWMPPIALVLAVELTAFALLISYLYRAGLQPLPTLIVALFADRLLLLAITSTIAPALGLPPKLTGLSAVLYGLPGVVLILVATPLLLARLAPYIEE